MVNGALTRGGRSALRIWSLAGVVLAALALAGCVALAARTLDAPAPIATPEPPAALAAANAPRPAATTPPPVAAPRPAGPPPVADVVRSGVLIVISKASQRMHVFKDGTAWGASPVSTGRRGHETPAGVFPILQKAAFHRSNTYSNAPMPFMQRLTWRGVAIHAGRLPGYPASHGCIRLPYGFARALFGLTRPAATTVVVTNAPVRSDQHAVALALGTPVPAERVVLPVLGSGSPSWAAADGAARPVGETIQLAATATAGEAEARWDAIVARFPDLGRYRKSVVPAAVGARQVWRLRASAPGARALCTAMKRAGQDCFNVI